MPKILRVITRLNIGGPAIHVANLCDLAERGFETVLVHGAPGPEEGDMAYLLEGRSVRTCVLPDLVRPISPRRDVKVLWQLIRLIRRERPDIVHTHTAKAGMLGRVAAVLGRVPQICHTYHGHVFHGYFSAPGSRLFVAVERMLAAFTTRMLVLGPGQREEIAGILRLPPSRFAVVPLGFDLAGLAQPRAGGPDAWYPAATRPLIAIVGRLAPIKNHELFLDVLGRLQAQGHPFTAFVIGDGARRVDLMRRAADQGLADRVLFTGWIRDLAPAYHAIDYVFLTSRNEGTPVALIEAMAAGRIVLATDVGGVKDVVRDGTNGFLVRGFSPRDFAQRFLEVHRLPASDLARIAAEARRTAAAYDVQRLLTNMARLYAGRGEGAGR